MGIGDGWDTLRNKGTLCYVSCYGSGGNNGAQLPDCVVSMSTSPCAGDGRSPKWPWHANWQFGFTG